jgi:glucose/arabinose dehydrogenase
MRTTTCLIVVLAAAACSSSDRSAANDSGAAKQSATKPACTTGSDSLVLPTGFCATVFADSLGHSRHIAVAPNGDVYVNTWSGPYYPPGTTPNLPQIVALRDTNHDGRADVVARFGPPPSKASTGGTGIAVFNNALYVEDGSAIVRYAIPQDGLAPTTPPDTIVKSLPLTGDHPMHPFAIDAGGGLYVDLGSASNSCQVKNRTIDSKGVDPCKELQTRGGVWKYDANKTGQVFSTKERFATGIRNAVGIAVAPNGSVYSTQHGRDQLAENWPKLYNAQQGQDLPAEELMKLEDGGDYGWPYCYYDGTQQKLVLAPEYGGDGGKSQGQCTGKKTPVAAFPAHWAPDDLLFYRGTMFPAKYRDGVFIAFHGSWNRAPGPQGGYKIVFQPLSGDAANGPLETFADNFARGVLQPDRAAHRPAGLAQDAAGALYVTDDVRGKVWRISY